MKHVNDTLSLMKALTNDNRFEEAMNRNDRNKEAANMSEALTKLIKEGEERGEARGEERGKIITKRDTARNLKAYGMDDDTIAKMVNANLSAVKEWLK